ncbi:hypothetical protein ACFWGL_17000 [Streptomyces sp. NPDC060286]|uniref:hypothetical protein n=1 Tax=unclassified Streptomyces TaxID=2593676 RepID=UPI0035DBDBD1
MSITLMTAGQRAAVAAQLGTTTPATPDQAVATTDVARLAIAHPAGPVATSRARTALLGISALAARLVAVEQLLDTTRRALATVIHAANSGDDYDLSDLMWELERAGVDTKAELDDAEALADVAARAEALR